MRRTIFAILASLLVPALLVADVTWEEETKMGGMMKIMTMGKGMKSTTHVSGNFMRTDNDSNATIVDLEGEKILNLDTKKKTYTVTTFAEMMKKMESAMATASAKKSEQKQGSDVTMSADVDVTETGRSETIGGVTCNQYLMQMDVTFESQKEQQSGTMSTVMEVWLSKNVPGMEEVNAFYRKMGEKLGTTSIAQKWAAGGAENPQMNANMQKMADEMRKMDGHSMRSVMYFGDAEAAKAEAMGQKQEGGGGGGGLGGLADMMKRMKQQEGGGEQSNQAPGGVMMKMTTETKRIETKPIDPKLFAVPADYKLVTESR